MRKTLFKNKSSLDVNLANDILKQLNKYRNENGKASILFSGGSTPHGMLKQLAESTFDWSDIIVSLVDDRVVEKTSEYSNSAMIENLFLNKINGTKPHFYQLVLHPEEAINNMNEVLGYMDKLSFPDIVILGMGPDGHFASLFPNDKASAEGLKLTFNKPLIYTNAPQEPKKRISFSWSYLRKASEIYLHITGEEKLKLLIQKEKRAEVLPIDTLLNDQEVKPTLYWAP